MLDPTDTPGPPPTLDLHAPILPGQGAGALRLGMAAEGLVRGLGALFSTEEIVNACIQAPTGITRYRSTPLDFWTCDGVVIQVCVHGGYRGTLRGGSGAIGLGATLAAAAASLGALRQTATRTFVPAEVAGVAVEVAAVPPHAQATADRAGRGAPRAEPVITHIYIFPPEET